MGSYMSKSDSRAKDYKLVSSREIKTKYGKIVGKRMVAEPEVDAYLGIPYAKPPLGELRFKKPQEPDTWEGVRPAVQFARRCIQRDMFIIERLRVGPTSEDCLYLNVFCPAWELEKSDHDKVPPFPVMVYVHGGSFTSDSAVKYGDIGICQHLVAENGIIVVTIQYRLGLFGFFSTGDDACDDNVALWDMTLALQWVQENIEAFGGDKTRVTLFGQSAGGACVDLLSLSPHSRDLFAQVIPMAGNAECEWALNDNVVDTCRSYSHKLGIYEEDSYELIRKLQSVPANKLAMGFRVDSDASCTRLQTEIGPRMDGKFFPKPLDQLRADSPKKPILTGVCECEGLLLHLFASNLSMSRMEHIIAERIPEWRYPNFKELRAQALALYITSRERHDMKAMNLAICKLFSDVFLANDTQQCVNAHLARGESRVYLYSFDYFNPRSFGLIGLKMPFKAATHCTELAYLFQVGIINTYKFNPDDYRVLRTMTKLFANFARYGDPNGSESFAQSQLPFKWTPATIERPSAHLSIDLEPSMKEDFQGGRAKFWLDLHNHAAHCLCQRR